jgi:hypothetical protein
MTGVAITDSLNYLPIVGYEDNGTGMITPLDCVDDILVGVIHINLTEYGVDPFPLDNHTSPTVVDNRHLHLFSRETGGEPIPKPTPGRFGMPQIV